jgi:hypothetical protein
MELFFLVAILVIAYALYFFIKFNAFKSRLMNEFGRQGINYEKADDIFFRDRDTINNMYHDNIPIKEIVGRYTIDEVSRDTEKKLRTVVNDDAAASEIGQVSDLVAKIVLTQITLASMGDDDILEILKSDWSIGYIAGISDAAISRKGLDPDIEGAALITMVFINVFDLQTGPELFGKFMRLQKEKNVSVDDGMMVGGQEMFDWTSQKINFPHGLADYINSNNYK